MGATWTSLVGWTLVAAGGAAAVPQVLHLLRARTVDGLSPTTELLWVLSRGLWLWCVIDLGLLPRIASEATSLLLEAVVAGLLFAGLARARAARAAFRAAAPLLLLGLAAVVLARDVWGVHGMMIALIGLDAAALVPLVRTTLGSSSLAGVSACTWSMKAAVYGGWIGYAVALGQPGAAGRQWLMAPLAVFLLVRLVADRGAADRMVVSAARLLRGHRGYRMVAPVGAVLVGLRRG